MNQHFAGAKQTPLVTLDILDPKLPGEHGDCEACRAWHFHGCGGKLRKVCDFDKDGISISVNLDVSHLCRFGAHILNGHADVVVLRADDINAPAGYLNFYSLAGFKRWKRWRRLNSKRNRQVPGPAVRVLLTPIPDSDLNCSWMFPIGSPDPPAVTGVRSRHNRLTSPA